jgi:hypothetical protein
MEKPDSQISNYKDNLHGILLESEIELPPSGITGDSNNAKERWNPLQ